MFTSHHQAPSLLVRGSAALALLLPIAVLAASAGCGKDDLARLPGAGGIDGYICNPLSDTLAVGATIQGQSAQGPTATLSNDLGYFVLDGLREGAQTLQISGSLTDPFSSELPVAVIANTITRLPEPSCLYRTGNLRGRICASELGLSLGQEYWVAGAKVTIKSGGVIYGTDLTDADGYFLLPDVPGGRHTLDVRKGSFATQRTVDVVPDQTTDLPTICFGADTAMAVVSGQFDAIETVLTDDLNFLIGGCLAGSGSLYCSGINAEPSGNVALVDGQPNVMAGDYYFVSDFLCQQDLNQFDILFLNCGLRDQLVWGGACSDLPFRLQDFVARGGSIYASDYAYEVIRFAFPGMFDFYGNEAQAGQARVGMASNTLAATVTDQTLSDVLRSGSVSLAFDKNAWVVLEPIQPAGVTVWLQGDVAIDSNGDGLGDATLSNAPLLVSAEEGEGRVLFTSFHTSQQGASSAVLDILRYIVFEL